ncbi:MAG: hypothetical protein ACR2PR_06165 [Pseudohongiellaceae bacterium]
MSFDLMDTPHIGTDWEGCFCLPCFVRHISERARQEKPDDKGRYIIKRDEVAECCWCHLPTSELGKDYIAFIDGETIKRAYCLECIAQQADNYDQARLDRNRKAAG